MTKAKAPDQATSFNSSIADGGHAASPPGLASAHTKRPGVTVEQSAKIGAVDEKTFGEGLERLGAQKDNDKPTIGDDAPGDG